jgi:glycosyltransferase involved in cell wall biosynthesis
VRELHVAVDARLANAAGIGTYLRSLVPRIAAARPRWRITALGNPAELTRLGWADLGNVELGACRSAHFTVGEQLELPVRCPWSVDVFWAPLYNVPILLGRPLVVTVHDVCHLALRESVSGPLTRSYARWMMTHVARRAAGVLFDSHFSRDEMSRLGLSPTGHTAVAPLAVEPSWFAAKATYPSNPLGKPYIIYVGNLKRHKNVPLLLRAFGRLTAEVPHDLVVIGRREGLNADPAIDAAAAQLGGRVMFTGEVTQDRLQQLVASASALVTASLYEGFGLPPLEAMAAGTPCVVSRAGSLPEICGDAVVYCDPRDEESVTSAIRQVLLDEPTRRRLRERGAARARSFQWDACARVTAEMLESAA